MKPLILGFIAVIIIFGGGFLLLKDRLPAGTEEVAGNNVSIVNGVQIIEIRAKGGYQPRESVAKAGIPTILRFNTKGTFDCSSAVRIPSLDIEKILPPSGATDITLGEQASGTLQGSCGMGMYPFEIEFQS
ncbi:MAG: cupredoxin domain-containing protein [Candidatus Magasanikbacteria bacterium]|nr:cupredoxin domain-containing protein [Candidatus Magasanikbacteria bacterium]